MIQLTPLMPLCQVNRMLCSIAREIGLTPVEADRPALSGGHVMQAFKDESWSTRTAPSY